MEVCYLFAIKMFNQGNKSKRQKAYSGKKLAQAVAIVIAGTTPILVFGAERVSDKPVVITGESDKPIDRYFPSQSPGRDTYSKSKCWLTPSDDQACFEPSPSPDAIYQYSNPDPAKDRQVSVDGVACGNPVVVSSGNKIESETDYVAEGDFPLSIVRNYNANSGIAFGLFGPRWMSKFDMTFVPTQVVDDNTGDTYFDYRLYRDDGTTIKLEQGVNAAFKLVGIDESQARVITDAQNNYVYQAADGSQETYSPSGRLLKITNPQGISWNFQYRQTNRNQFVLWKVTHTNGRVLTFNVDDGLILRGITTPAGNSFAYERSQWSGQILNIKTTYPAGASQIGASSSDVTIYAHQYAGPIGALYSKTINGSVFATYEYNSYGDNSSKVSKEYHAGGVNTFLYSYNSPTMTSTTVTNPLGGVTTFGYDSGSSEIRSTQISGTANCPALTATLNRDPANRRKVETGTDGITVETTFDIAGNIIRKVAGFGDANPEVTTYTWNSAPRLIASQTTASLRTEYVYDQQRRIKKLIETDLTGYGASRVTQYTYIDVDNNGLPEKVIIDGPTPGYQRALTYNAQGDLVSSSDAQGTTTYSNFNGDGRPTTITYPAGSVTSIVYDGRGRIQSTTSQGLQTLFAYDWFGKVRAIRSPDGTTTNYLYDSAYRKVGIQRNDTYRQALAGGTATFVDAEKWNLDAMGNVTSVTLARNTTNLSVNFKDFDVYGRSSATRGNNGQRLDIARYAGGAIRQLTDANGTALQANTYDGVGRISSQKDAEGGKTSYSYDTSGNLSQLTDPRGQVTSYIYDGLGNLRRKTSPDTGVTNYSYNTSGVLAGESRADGTNLTYGYQADGRLATLISSRLGLNITRTYSWDACTNGAGLICGITESSGEGISFTYTNQGQIQTKTDVIGGQSFVTRYDYNNAGQPTKLTYPNGVTLSYFWQDGVIRNLTVNNGVSTTVVNAAVYRPFGPVESFTDRLGSTRTFAYDNDSRLTGISDAAGAVSFGFDKRDLITSVSQADISSVGYSAMGRLTSAVQTDLTSAFTYDTNGNRATATYAGYGSSTYAYASYSNQLLSVTSGSNVRTFKYDGAGNLTQDTKSGATDCHRYDAFGRLAQFERYSAAVDCSTASASGASIVGSYKFNGLDQRSSKTSQGISTKLIYNAAGQLIYEWSSQGLARSYIWFNDQLVAIEQAGVVFSVYSDQLSRPRKVLAPDQTVRWSASNRAFDRVIRSDSISGLNIGFPGQYFDSESGLWQNWNRTYDASIGRYTQSDPIGLTAGTNTYAYVGSNPVSFIDPYGLSALGNAGAFLGGWGGRAGGVVVGEAIFPAGGGVPGAVIGGRLGALGGRAAGEWLNGVLFSKARGEYDEDERGGTCRINRGSGDGGMPGNNQAQNRQSNAAATLAGLNREEKEVFHRAISGQGFGWDDLVKVANQIKAGQW